MPENQYPAFEGGQTLTSHDLNQLRTFLHQRDRLLGRLVGFGVSCGLGGTVSGATLTIGPGLAIDQLGEPLALAAPRAIPLPPAVAAGAFDFVAAGPGGFSVVLEATDTVEPAPDCGDAGCEGHAALHTRSAALQVVAGRITGPWYDFADEPLLDVEPMRLSITSAPQGSYVTLRDAIVSRLTNGGSPLISTVLIGQLQATSIGGGDLPGVKGYKSAFLNEVLFATLDLLRALALSDVTCARTAVRPGVVLGWLQLVGGAWTWDCAYKHAWEPPAGLVQTLVGGSCSDPAGLYRDLVESLIAGYAPPDPPPPPSSGGGVVTDPVFEYCKYGGRLVKGKCLNVKYPPEKIREKWYELWKDPLGPRRKPSPLDVLTMTGGLPATDVYETFPLGGGDGGGGVLTLHEALGRDALKTKGQLEKAVRDLNGTPNVLIRTAAEVTKMPGYEPSGGGELGATLVLTVDTQGLVVATGRIPAAFTALSLGTALPAATAMATEALDTVANQGNVLQALDVGVSELKDGMEQLGEFRSATAEWKGTVDRAIGGIDMVVKENVDKAFTGTVRVMQERIATVEGSVRVLVGQPGRGTVPGIGRIEGITRMDQDVARGLTDFAGTVTASLQTLVTADNERTLGRHVTEATRAAAKLEEVAVGGEPVEIGDAAVQLLGTLRTAVKAAGIEAGLGRRLDDQFNAVRGLLG